MVEKYKISFLSEVVHVMLVINTTDSVVRRYPGNRRTIVGRTTKSVLSVSSVTHCTRTGVSFIFDTKTKYVYTITT